MGGVPPDLCMYYEGKLLQADRTLADYNIQSTRTVELGLPLRGVPHMEDTGGDSAPSATDSIAASPEPVDADPSPTVVPAGAGGGGSVAAVPPSSAAAPPPSASSEPTGISQDYSVPVMSPEAAAAASLPLSSVRADPASLREILEEHGFAIVEDVCGCVPSPVCVVLLLFSVGEVHRNPCILIAASALYRAWVVSYGRNTRIVFPTPHFFCPVPHCDSLSLPPPPQRPNLSCSPSPPSLSCGCTIDHTAKPGSL
jgi:hypothetical protein